MQSIIDTLKDYFSEWVDYVQDMFGVLYDLLTDPVDIFNTLWQFILEMLYTLTNEIIVIIAGLTRSVASLLPDIWPQTMVNLDTIPSRWLSALNWAIPFDHFSVAVSVLIVSTISWVSIGIVFRWLKVFQ